MKGKVGSRLFSIPLWMGAFFFLMGCQETLEEHRPSADLDERGISEVVSAPLPTERVEPAASGRSNFIPPELQGFAASLAGWDVRSEILLNITYASRLDRSFKTTNLDMQRPKIDSEGISQDSGVISFSKFSLVVRLKNPEMCGELYLDDFHVLLCPGEVPTLTVSSESSRSLAVSAVAGNQEVIIPVASASDYQKISEYATQKAEQIPVASTHDVDLEDQDTKVSEAGVLQNIMDAEQLTLLRQVAEGDSKTDREVQQSPSASTDPTEGASNTDAMNASNLTGGNNPSQQSNISGYGVGGVAAAGTAVYASQAGPGVVATPPGFHISLVPGDQGGGIRVGTFNNIVLAAIHPDGSRMEGYIGTVTLSSSDPKDKNYFINGKTHTFLASDMGTKTFFDNGIFLTSGTQTITARDESGRMASTPFQVTAGDPSSMTVSGASPQTLARNTAPQAVQVVVKDEFQNPISGIAAQVHIVETDERLNGTTDASGNAVIQLPLISIAGNYSVRVFLPAWPRIPSRNYTITVTP